MNIYLKKFKALSDKTRFRIIKLLENKVMCVCEIREVIGFSMATISNHLRILHEADLIISNKEDKYVNYSLNNKSVDNNKFFEILKDINDPILEQDRRKATQSDRTKIC